ncbi:MAG: PilN domain-containing protein [Rhodocyclaceae bacterium]|nr:PilN domain-containing protein [Rhodocyclaceae bacterium]
MSQQINLYDPALLRKRELLTAANLAAAAVVLLLLVGGWGAVVRTHLGTLESESQALAPQVKGLQDQMIAMGKQLAERKPDPQLEADLASARDLLALRSALVVVLKKGVGAEAAGYAEYLRGLARQTPNGLWLTGLTISDGGASMEIRGRMTDPALLPEYIRRLDAEPAFKGRAFAALTVTAGKAETTDQPPAPAPAPPAVQAPRSRTPEPAQTPAAAPAPTSATAGPPPFHEFTLTPVPAARPSGAAGSPAAEGH